MVKIKGDFKGKSLCQLIGDKSSNIKCVDFEFFLFSSVIVQELINKYFEYQESKVLVKLSGQFLYMMIYQQYVNVDFLLAFIFSQIFLAT